MPRSSARNRSNSFADLAAQEERLRLIILAAEFGTFDYDPGRDTLLWDDKCRELFGVPLGAPVSYRTSFVAALHPDDRDETLRTLSRICTPGSPDEPFELRYRTIGISDGVVRNIVARGRRMRLTDESVRFLGIVAQLPDEPGNGRFVIRGRGKDGAVAASCGRAASALVLARRWQDVGIRGVTIAEPHGMPLQLDVFRARFFPTSTTEMK